MTQIRLTITAEPEEFILAVKAVQHAIRHDNHSVIISYGDAPERTFLVRKTKAGWSSMAAKREDCPIVAPGL
jgi:hypothetical protein